MIFGTQKSHSYAVSVKTSHDYPLAIISPPCVYNIEYVQILLLPYVSYSTNRITLTNLLEGRRFLTENTEISICRIW